MADKAILITRENKSRLQAKYNEETTTGVALAEGYYLVAGFGDHLGYELLSAANFNAKYTKGDELLNGFFHAVLKEPQGGS